MTDADARGSESVTKDGAMIGRTTSGGYGWRTGKSLALAMVKPEFSHEEASSTCAFSARRAGPWSSPTVLMTRRTRC